MAFKGHRIELRRADRKQPNFALVKHADITRTHSGKIPVYHPHGIGVGLRSWGEPPLKSGFAVAQLTTSGWRPRVLLCILAEERWRLQSLSPHTLIKLQGLGATDAPVAASAGNAITGAMSRHVVAKLLPRYAQQCHAGVVHGHPIVPYLRPVCFASVNDMKHVVTIPVTTSPSSCLSVVSGMWAISFSYVEEGRAHKLSSLRASQVASKITGTDLDAILCGHLDQGVLVYAWPFHGPPPSPLLQWHTPRTVQSHQLQLMMSSAHLCLSVHLKAPSVTLRLS